MKVVSAVKSVLDIGRSHKKRRTKKAAKKRTPPRKANGEFRKRKKRS